MLFYALCSWSFDGTLTFWALGALLSSCVEVSGDGCLGTGLSLGFCRMDRPLMEEVSNGRRGLFGSG